MTTEPRNKRFIHFNPSKDPLQNPRCTNIPWVPGGYLWTTEKAEYVTCPECLERLDGRGK